MTAFHTLFSKPKYLDELNMTDSEILVMILSALKWQQNMGDIVLCADDLAIKFIIKNNLDFLWSNIINLYYDEIDYTTFWAGSKIFALKKQKAPIVMLDLDMIVWNKIELNNSVVAIHSEPIIENIYKPKEYFYMEKGYIFDNSFSWDVLPSNTALLYIEDDLFKNYYCDTSIDFMKNTKKTDDRLSYMVFAEQRLLSMCADLKNIKINYLIDYPKDLGNQDFFTHIWGYKNILSNDSKQDYFFCKRCVNRIMTDFSKESLFLLDKDFFNKYLI